MKLKAWRQLHGKSQTEVSVGTGIAHTLISKYETTGMQPRVDNILKIQRFTGGEVTIADWQNADDVQPRIVPDDVQPPAPDDPPVIQREA